MEIPNLPHLIVKKLNQHFIENESLTREQFNEMCKRLLQELVNAL